jgi:hypothetical protein
MKKITFLLLFWCYSQSSIAQSGNIYVETTNNQMKLKVNGKDFMINGMNWDYFPIGTNYNYSLWKQSDDVIKAALDTEMSLLRNMGVNAIRQYTGVPPKWIQYIYEKYGIYTMLNHSFGRYGLNVNGKWIPNTEYADPSTEALLLAESTAMVTEYQNTPGILLFLLGNENNYGLFWGGAETEDIPVKDRKSTARAQAMYKVFNKAVVAMKAIDKTHPMAICNGDLLFIELIAKECKDIDILGVNMYRGATFTDAFETVKKELNKPLLFTEFGADAFNARENQEDQKSQAYYNVENWKDIYSNAAGMGKAGNSLGGFTFQFSDGWWKFGQTVGLDVHDNNASWSNGGYPLDLVPGENNMNEEWFGICAKGPTNNRGLYDLYPRAAYYALQEVHKINPFELGATLETIKKSFDAINMMDAVLRARGDKAAMGGSSNDILKISNLRAEFTTFNTGGTLLTTPETADPDNQIYPNKTGFDHMESYFVGVEGNPAPNMKANVNVNILGRVAENPINEIFYENRGRLQTVDTPNGPLVVNDFNRVQVYNASYTWNAKDFDIRGFYRTGHYHWGYEGDFFALYPETNYGPNLDIYNGETSGMEFDGKGILKGFKAAFGPQLWWGANPAFLLKYGRKVGSFNLTGVYHRDLNTNIRYDENGNRILNQNQVRSGVIPPWVTERATIAIQRQFGDFGVVLGGIWGGNPLNGVSFLVSEDGVVNANNRISGRDNWGGKAKITFSSGRFNVYTQGAIMGLVAGGGADNTQTFTGWQLKDSGSGNQTNFLTGFTYNVNANLQIAPNFLWQKPIIDAIPNDFSGAGRLRNILDDPFVVRANRETVGGELLLTWDPTPATWMYEWDNDMNEDALFALSTGFVYRHLPTTQDAAIGFQADRSFLRFPRSAPAQDLWESNTRIVSKVSPDLGLIANIYFGNGQANGDSERTINRAGGDLRVVYQKVKLTSSLKFNDWGPFDYHRDFNITFPVQTSVDLSTSIGKQNWFILPNTKIGIMGIWRSMDQNSGGRYAPNAVLPDTFPAVPTISPVGFGNGSEWEIRTYIHINIGK